MRKDKQKVLDEVWTEERVRSFLDVRSFDDTDTDFHVLLKAYQSMRLSNFEQFVGFFKEAGRNLDAINPEGRTVLSIIRDHNKGRDYAAVLTAAGAS